MNVKERLKSYIESSKMSVKAFELSIDVSNGYINSISKSIGIDKLQLILEKYPNLNLEWLITGKGEMLRNSEVKTIQEPQEKLQAVNEPQTEELEKGKSLLEIIKNKDQIILQQMDLLHTLLRPISNTLEIQGKKLEELGNFNEMLKLYYKIEIEESEIKEAIKLEQKSVKG